MRIATWNVNSLPARLVKVQWWLERAQPDVLLLQETKVTDAAAPYKAFEALGYELVHHGTGGRNGVAIASRVGVADVVTNFGAALEREKTAESDDEPFAEPRMIAGTCKGVRVVSLYAPNGRTLDSIFYAAKLRWFDRLIAWASEQASPLILGGDFNVAPDDRDVWDAEACHGGTHVSGAERAKVRALCDLGFVDGYRARHEEGERYSWWDYRAGAFHKNFGMRIDLMMVSKDLSKRVVHAEIDREARKGKPIPSDHAPVVIDLDEPGTAFDAGWKDASERIAARRAGSRA